MSGNRDPHPLERSIFLQAAELESSVERAAFLDRACEGDRHLRERVDRLLNFSEAESFGPAIAAGEVTLTGTSIPSPSRSPVAEDNYEIGPELARGGMGSIRQAEDRKLKRSVAVKIMHSHVGSDPSAQARFVREAEVLALLSHPNIVPVYDIVWENGKPLFYTMKLVKGRTLQQIVNELREKDPDTLTEYHLDHLLGVFLKVCDAIAFAHSRGIIHRDLKPENVMVGEFGEVLVMDWGIAKILGSGDEIPREGSQDAAVAAMHLGATLEGSVMGTPQYMSPEQAAGEITEMDARSDIYSLGAILYAILTLRPPVEGADVHEVLEKVQTGDLTPITEAGSTRRSGEATAKGDVLEAAKIQPLPHVSGGRIPSGLSSVAMKALSLRKESRYQSIAALGKDIEKFQGGFATEAERASLGKQLMLLLKRNKGIFSTAAAAWFLITGLAVWFVLNLQAKERRAVAGEASAKTAQGVAEQEKETARKSSAEARLALADAALRERNGTLMKSVLGEVDEDLRTAEWRYLLAEAESSVANLTTGEWDIHDVVADPSRSGMFALADSRRMVTVAKARTGEKLLQFDGSVGVPYGRLKLAVSPDGSTIATAGTGGGPPSAKEPGGIAIWSLRDGTRLREWPSSRTEQLGFNADGSVLLQAPMIPGSYTSTDVQAWEVGTGNLLWTAKGLGRFIMADFLPDSRHIVVCPDFGSISILSALDGSTLKRFPKPDSTTAAVNPDGNRLIVALQKGDIQAFDLEDAKVVFQIPRERPASHLAFRADGRQFASVTPLEDARQRIEIWDAGTGALLRSMLGGDGVVNGIAIHPVSDELAVVGKRSKLYDIGGQETWTFTGSNPWHAATFWGRDDLVLEELLDSIALRKLDVGRSMIHWKPDPGVCRGKQRVSVSGNLALAVMIGTEAPAVLFQDTGSRIEKVGAFSLQDFDFAASIWLSPAGDRFMARHKYDSGRVSVFDSKRGTKLATLERAGLRGIRDLVWIGGGARILGLAVANADRGEPPSEERAVVWDAVTGQILRAVANTTPMDVLALSPDGKRFAEGGMDKKVRIRDVETLKVQQEFRVHNAPITGLAWHPDKPILVTSSEDLVIRLWNLETGECLEELYGSNSAPTSLVFSPGGIRLASADKSFTRIWEPESLKP